MNKKPQARPRPKKRKTRKPVAKKPKREHTKVSKSVGAIVLNKHNHVLLVFQQKNKYWEFPKGKVENGETELQTLRREIFEETGIRKFNLFDNFRHSMFYEFQYKGNVIKRKVVYYLIRTGQRVRISDEHARYAWLPIERAKKRLKHKNQIALMDTVKQRTNEQGTPIEEYRK